MPRDDAGALRARLPKTKPFLMYGLTEAFRSTYLPPDEVDQRPDSIGKAIPNAEILVLREDGSPCAPTNPANSSIAAPWSAWATGTTRKDGRTLQAAEHAGPRIRVSSSPRWRSSPATRCTQRRGGLPLLHRSPRRDDEDVRLPGEPDRGRGSPLRAPAGGRMRRFRRRPRPRSGTRSGNRHAWQLAANARSAALLAECRDGCLRTWCRSGHRRSDRALPRNPNGKIDRKLLADEFRDLYLGGCVRMQIAPLKEAADSSSAPPPVTNPFPGRERGTGDRRSPAHSPRRARRANAFLSPTTATC
jgi:hypothetical protein